MYNGALTFKNLEENTNVKVHMLANGRTGIYIKYNMSEFNFDVFDTELSPSEELACVQDAVRLAERLFGKTNTSRIKQTAEVTHTNGQFARLSRLIVKGETEFSLVIGSDLFLPSSVPLEAEYYEEKGLDPEFICAAIYGNSINFNIDTADGKVTVTHNEALLTVNCFGDTEIDCLPIEANDELTTMTPRISDRGYLQSVEDILFK